MAYALLEGLIFPKIKELHKKMLGAPKSVMEKGNLTVKVTKLLSAIKNARIETKA